MGMKKNEDMKPLVICKACLHWKDASAATGFRYAFCDEFHKATVWDFFCKYGKEEEGKK